jgi:hypothetical protein
MVTTILLCLALATTETTQISDTQTQPADPVLSAKALNASEADRTTDTIVVAGRTEITAMIEYERGATGAATAITLTCFAGRTKGKMGAIPILADSVTLGTSDSYPHVWRQLNVTASMVIRWIITPLNDKYLKCIVGSEGVVTADDVIARIDFRLGRL